MLDIRTATEADFAELRNMWLEFEAYLNAIDDPSEIVPSRFEALRALAFAPRPKCSILVAEMDGEAAGYLVFHIGVHMDDLAPAVFVADLFVREKYHRQGVGTALMLDVRTRARAENATRMFWTVWRKNAGARAFYERLGAVPFSDEILLVWDVAAGATPR